MAAATKIQAVTRGKADRKAAGKGELFRFERA